MGARTKPGGSGEARVSVGWLLVMIGIIALAWGNSLVPGTGSGEISGAVLEAARSALAALGLPADWLTNFIVRKTAHFTEYFCLGVSAMLAMHPYRMGDAPRSRRVARALACALVLVCVPSIDESIQRFISVGRTGQVRDVLLDCSGALCGSLLALAIGARRARRHRGDAR
jgi:VanZ family protein